MISLKLQKLVLHKLLFLSMSVFLCLKSVLLFQPIQDLYLAWMWFLNVVTITTSFYVSR